MLTFRGFSNVGLAMCILAAGLLACNQFGALNALTPYYRVNTPALCLLFGFATACWSMRLAIAGCVFALPLLAALLLAAPLVRAVWVRLPLPPAWRAARSGGLQPAASPTASDDA